MLSVMLRVSVVCLSVCMYVSICLSICMYVCTSMYVYVSACVSVDGLIRYEVGNVGERLCVYCAYTYVSICIYTFQHLCMYL